MTTQEELLDILQAVMPVAPLEVLPRIEVALIQHRPDAIKGFAKTREGRRAQFISDFTDESQRCCHVCDKVVPLESLLDRKSGAKASSFTGRVYCGDACWEKYMEAEGL